MEDEICPYATFHLLGFREEMDPTKAMNFQTFPHQNGHAGPVPGHAGTMLPPGHPGHVHSRSGSQSMPRANRYQRKNSQGGQSSIYTPAPEYDDPANCAEEDQYVSNNQSQISSRMSNALYCWSCSVDTPVSTRKAVACTPDPDPNTTIPPTAHPKRISTAPSTEDPMDSPMITTVPGDPWDVAASVSEEPLKIYDLVNS